MKILMVAIPNHHFFQWVNQLKGAGYAVYWFDITDGGPKVERIHWVYQIKGWKLRSDFPFRTSLKKKYPKLYHYINRYNERDTSKALRLQIQNINPDIIHCFEMVLTGLPVFNVLQKIKTPLIFSSWGSDMYNYKTFNVSTTQAKAYLQRVDYLITDCKRDFEIAKSLNYNNTYLGVFPGNGGITINQMHIKPQNERHIILVKGYNDGVGKAIEVLKALEMLTIDFYLNKEIVVYSADDVVVNYLKQSPFFSKLKTTCFSRYTFMDNNALLKIMGNSILHIGNSISDGMPNVLLEAMAMGAFPIQSNPGGVTAEIIEHAKNGFLIADPLSPKQISKHIKDALLNAELRRSAQDYNVNFIKSNYNREHLKPKIVSLYNSILSSAK